jgi:hypothetical protein
VPQPAPSLAARVLPESVRAEPEKTEPRPIVTLAPHVNPAELLPEWQNTPVHRIASRTDLDEAAASILATLLAKHGVGAKAASWRSVSSAGLGHGSGGTSASHPHPLVTRPLSPEEQERPGSGKNGPRQARHWGVSEASQTMSEWRCCGRRSERSLADQPYLRRAHGEAAAKRSPAGRAGGASCRRR